MGDEAFEARPASRPFAFIRGSLFIVRLPVSGRFRRRVVCHRADDLLDEGDLTRCESVFRVKVLVSPLLFPLLDGHEGVDFARNVLGGLVQEDQEARQPTGKVR